MKKQPGWSENHYKDYYSVNNIRKMAYPVKIKQSDILAFHLTDNKKKKELETTYAVSSP